MNKTITIRYQKFQMYQAPTGWVFVRSPQTKKTYSVAKILDGQIVEVDPQPAIKWATNEELANAWVNQ